MINHLFVYGTLMPDHPNHYMGRGTIQRARATNYQYATAEGTLVERGHPWPLVKFDDSGGIIYGGVWEITPEGLREVDFFEGYSEQAPPELNLFTRKPITVRLHDGSSLEAWGYEWNRPID